MSVVRAGRERRVVIAGSEKHYQAGPHPPQTLEGVLWAPTLPTTLEQWRGVLSKGTTEGPNVL